MVTKTLFALGIEEQQRDLLEMVATEAERRATPGTVGGSELKRFAAWVRAQKAAL